MGELAMAVGLRNDAVVATNAKRYERRLQNQYRGTEPDETGQPEGVIRPNG